MIKRRTYKKSDGTIVYEIYIQSHLGLYELSSLLAQLTNFVGIRRLSRLFQKSCVSDILDLEKTLSETPKSWEDDREKVYGCRYDGQNYVAVYNKEANTLQITKNLRRMQENVHLMGIEERLPVDDFIVYLPPDSKPFSMGRVRQIEYT